jgi:cytochrome c553
MRIEHKRLAFDLTAWIATPVLVFSLLALDADARPGRNAADNATWRAECGGCHVPYPPHLLSAAEWRQLMGSLDRHFGTDAAVEPKSAAEIADFLATNAGRGDGRATPAEPRITTTRWFAHEHGEIAAATFGSPAVKTAANCAACHPGATRGNFDEHAVRIPR